MSGRPSGLWCCRLRRLARLGLASVAPDARGANLLSGLNLEDGTAEVAFRFKPVGLFAAWQIDDVYVDPFKSR